MTKESDQDEPGCLWFPPLAESESCPSPFRLMQLQPICSRRAAWPPPRSSVFAFPDQIIHLQQGRGRAIEARVRFVFTALQGKAVVTLLLVLFILFLITKQFLYSWKKHFHQLHFYPVMLLTAHPRTGGRLSCKFGT